MGEALEPKEVEVRLWELMVRANGAGVPRRALAIGIIASLPPFTPSTKVEVTGEGEVAKGEI